MLQLEFLTEGVPPIGYVLVTPELAEEWLKLNTHNRPLKKSLVAKYVADIENGCWHITHQGIAFDENGRLVDGQHRLYAIIVADVSIVMAVTDGVKSEAQLAFDDGGGRTAHDAFVLSGALPGVTRRHVQICRSMVFERSVKRPKTKTQLLEWLQKHWQAVDFTVSTVDDIGKRNGITQATVMAVIARGWYHVPLDKLRRFYEILYTGLCEPSEAVVIKLRDRILESQGNRATSQRATRLTIHRLTESALRAFVEGRTVTYLRHAKNELFPLPEEKE